MDYIQAIILGTIQGLTEFLPVSSSGHLVLFQNMFGLKEPELLFDICVHVGTLAAVCGIFFSDIRSILTTLLRLPRLLIQSGSLKRLYRENDDFRIVVLIMIGSIPTAVLGICFHAAAEQIFGAVWIVGCMLLVTGTLLWVTRRISHEGRKLSNATVKDALIIGFIQGLAILPGISRSGSTISVALLLGVNREFAARFSFLLSIPAIIGALLISIDSSVVRSSASAGAVLIGTVVAATIGYLALIILLKLVNKGRIYQFAPYCWLVGLSVIIWAIV